MGLIRRVFRDKGKPKPLPVSPPFCPDDWVKDVSAELRSAWLRDGYAVLPGVFGSEQIAAYNATVARVRGEIEAGGDAHGFGDRIGQLHQKEQSLLDLADHPKVLSLLRWAFGDDPLLFGSLNFERGTEQAAHIDGIFFWPEPCYSMAGVWIALEDVHPDAGPLFYVPGSHRWPFSRSEHLVAARRTLAKRRMASRSGRPEERADVAADLGRAWTEDFVKLEAERATSHVSLVVKAGDAVVWHSLLAHGGLPRRNPALSRKSVVFHYVGRRTKLYTFDQFMLYDAAALLREPPVTTEVRMHGALPYMGFPYFVTYNNGKQVVHAL